MKKTKIKENLAFVFLALLLTTNALASETFEMKSSSFKNTSYSSNEQPFQSQNDKNTGKISLGIEPRKQTSFIREAKYKIVVDSPFLPQTLSSEPDEYEIRFISESLSGSLDKNYFVLRPGEKIILSLNVFAINPGEHFFKIVVRSKSGKTETLEGYLTIPENNERNSRTRFEIQPEKQNTQTGNGEYYIIISRPLEYNCKSVSECAKIYPPVDYYLELNSEQELSFELGQTNALSLLPGEQVSLPLIVKAQKPGIYLFKINLKSENFQTSVRGMLNYEKKIEDNRIDSVISNTDYFNGEGFAINQDKSRGIYISLSLIGEKEIRGKAIIGKSNYAVKGVVSDYDRNLKLYFYDLKDGTFDKILVEFAGEVISFDTFSVIKGEMNFLDEKYPDKYWELNAINKKTRVFENEITFQEDLPAVTKKINRQEVVTIKQSSKNGEPSIEKNLETYIVPEKIETTKFLGIIPNPWGEKVLRVKLVEKEKITEKLIKEFGSANIGEYEVSIGSLKSEENIELSVKKLSNNQRTN